MADKIGLITQQDVPLKWLDSGDGTYAPVVGIDVGDITIGTVDQGAAGADPWLVEGEISQGAAGSDPWLINQKGAPNYANGQVTAGVASGVLVALRATRRYVSIRNQDATHSVYVGAGTVSSANGFLLKAGELITLNTTAAINCIRDDADVAVGYIEVYD
jgi:hypothetical protein